MNEFICVTLRSTANLSPWVGSILTLLYSKLGPCPVRLKHLLMISRFEFFIRYLGYFGEEVTLCPENSAPLPFPSPSQVPNHSILLEGADIHSQRPRASSTAPERISQRLGTGYGPSQKGFSYPPQEKTFALVKQVIPTL